MIRTACWILSVGCLLSQSASANEAPDASQLQQLRSVLSNRCFACHGPDAAEREGGFRMDQGDSMYHRPTPARRP